MKGLLFRTLLPALLFGPNVFAQEKPALVSRVETVFAEKEPRWRVKSKSAGQASPFVLHLKSGRGDVLVYIWIMESARTASEVFEGHTIAFGNTMGARGRKSKLPNFGDEGYMWTNFVVGGTAAVDFRVGNIYTHIIAPSQGTAKRFAQHVMNQIIEINKAKETGS